MKSRNSLKTALDPKVCQMAMNKKVERENMRIIYSHTNQIHKLIVSLQFLFQEICFDVNFLLVLEYIRG